MSTSEDGISVIMPVHNGGDYLCAAVDSILGQIEVELELIIIDDHSTDAALQQLTDDPRIKLIPSEGRGIVAALNTGLVHAQGHWIARMDADDIAAEDRLIVQKQFLLSTDVDIAGAKVRMFQTQGEIDQGYRLYQDWINSQITTEQIENNFYVESCIPHPTAFARKQVFKSLGGYQDPPWPEDYDLWHRARAAGFKFAKPDGHALLDWRDYGDRTSRRDSRYDKAQFLACKAHYLAQQLHKNKPPLPIKIWGTGPTGLKLHDLLEQHGISIEGFIDVNPKLAGRNKRGKEIDLINADGSDLDTVVKNCFTIAAVSARGARDEIRQLLGEEAGLIEGEDFLMAA